MEEINIKDLFRYFIRKIPGILLITMVVFSVGLIYLLFFKTPLYKGDTTLILVKNTSEDITQNDVVLNQKLVTTYSEIIKSRRVLNQVADVLSLDCSYQSLYNKVNVSSVSNTEIIKISVHDEDSLKAALIADTIANTFKYEVMDIYNLENVAIIDKAEVQNSPYNMNLVKDFVIFALAGFVLACGIYFAIYYFDNSIKSAEQVEERLKVSVIGSIPLTDGGVK